MDEKVLVWSVEDQVYWQSRCGARSRRLCDAALLTRNDANAICKRAMARGRGEHRIIELGNAFTSLQLEVKYNVNSGYNIN